MTTKISQVATIHVEYFEIIIFMMTHIQSCHTLFFQV